MHNSIIFIEKSNNGCHKDKDKNKCFILLQLQKSLVKEIFFKILILANNSMGELNSIPLDGADNEIISD